ncbi:MAG: cupin domain-containing protein [Thermoguttaceae bacterium]|nr:cupin domain-containing protein [Thermoguttaceae bacterium]
MNKDNKKENTGYRFVQMDDLPTMNCPCGQTRRAFTDDPDKTASLHLLEISKDSKTHYHKNTTEIYCVLYGEGILELDGQSIPVKPLTAVMIKPGCRHRATGNLTIINIPIPAFDPADEFFDE